MTTIDPNETDEQILQRIRNAESTIAVADRNKKQAIATLLDRREKEIQALLSMKPEPFGDVNLTIGNFAVKVNVPKKINWDEKLLAEKYKEIRESGEDADMYIDASYKISETKYKNFKPDVQSFFQDARTVASGNPSIKIEERE